MKTNKKFLVGDHLQQVGGYAGIAFNGKTWVRYDCSGCALASGLIKVGQRLSVSDHLQIWNKYFTFHPGMQIVRHDKELHRAWIEAGKPV